MIWPNVENQVASKFALLNNFLIGLWGLWNFLEAPINYMKNFVRIEKSLEAQINFNQNFETEKPERCLVVGIFTLSFHRSLVSSIRRFWPINWLGDNLFHLSNFVWIEKLEQCTDVSIFTIVLFLFIEPWWYPSGRFGRLD